MNKVMEIVMVRDLSNYPKSMANAVTDLLKDLELNLRDACLYDISEPYRCENNPYVLYLHNEGMNYIIDYYTDDRVTTAVAFADERLKDMVEYIINEKLDADYDKGTYIKYILFLYYHQNEHILHDMCKFPKAEDDITSVRLEIMKDAFAWCAYDAVDCLEWGKTYEDNDYDQFKEELRKGVSQALLCISKAAANVVLVYKDFQCTIPIVESQYKSIYEAVSRNNWFDDEDFELNVYEVRKDGTQVFNCTAYKKRG